MSGAGQGGKMNKPPMFFAVLVLYEEDKTATVWMGGRSFEIPDTVALQIAKLITDEIKKRGDHE